MNFPLLSLVILLPLLGAIATGVTRNIKLAKKIALAIAGLELILTLIVVLLFNASNGNNFQLVEQYAWIPSLNIEFLVGIDGISVLFLPMSALLTLMAIIASWNSVQHLHRFHFALLLALEGVTIGVFSALDTMLVLFILGTDFAAHLLFDRLMGHRSQAAQRGDEIHTVYAVWRRTVIICHYHTGH